MDLHQADDLYDSFIAYQKLMLREFDRMSGEYGFRVIDASRPVRRVAADLRRAVGRLVEGGETAKHHPAKPRSTEPTPTSLPSEPLAIDAVHESERAQTSG